MTKSSIVTPVTLSRRRMVAGALAAALISPAPSSAFFQQTKLEGTIGTDLGGVWLSTHHQMPEFRISYPKPANGPVAPVEVGPLSAEVEPLTGKNAAGVAVTKCVDAGFCNEYGIVVGDIVTAVNSSKLTDVASFEEAVANPAPTILLSIRRPALKMSTARLIKIRHVIGKKEEDGASVVEEELKVQMLDVALPFADKVEESRRTNVLFEPTAEQLEALGKNWFELPASTPPLFVKGSHRFVSKSSFDDSLASDKSLANSQYALIMDLGGNPMKGGGQLIDVYGIESADEKSMTGTYVSVTIASAPFPINIEFKGRFRMTKIADWSDQDDKVRTERNAARKPPEDLNKFKTLPDVPAPAAPPANPE